jgi:hypothetical protein
LPGTDSYLPEEKLHHQIEAGMTEKLIKCYMTEKLQNVVALCKWLLKVKQINDRMHAKHQEFEGIAQATCLESRKANTQGKLSHHVTTTFLNNPLTVASTCEGSPNSEKLNTSYSMQMKDVSSVVVYLCKRLRCADTMTTTPKKPWVNGLCVEPAAHICVH